MAFALLPQVNEQKGSKMEIKMESAKKPSFSGATLGLCLFGQVDKSVTLF